MSDEERPHIPTPPAPEAAPAETQAVPAAAQPAAGDLPPDPSASTLRARRRLKWLRLLLILFAVLMLGLVSFVFGMFMAVASDLPSLENEQQYDNARNSVLLDDQGRTIGVLSRQHQILVTPGQIPQIVKDAVISIEDKRFYSNSGIDLRSIARAFFQDILHQHAVQGASTIEQQFVKNALQAQAHRTIFEKLREAALAFHLAHKWSKEKIITEYLNTVYFGNGAYGIESAARTYFGNDVNHRGCGTPQNLCVSHLEPWEAALLAAIIRSPTEYDPVQHPAAALARRNLVLRQMLDQKYLTRSEYEESVNQALPAPKDIAPPSQPLVEGVDVGYFSSWVQQQVIERYGATRAYDGGLTIRTTLDLDLQRAAEEAVNAYLPSPEGPDASMVVIDNATGEVRAMVGGRSYDQSPFNLATEGERQPGSSFKAFDLAAALESGISPYSVWSSRVKIFHVPHSTESFIVHNDENAYSGESSLINATAYSDNTVYAEVGIKVGTKRIARLAHRMGITTPISTNYAMTIGGLKVGVTPLDMAHAYETIAHGGQRVSGTLVSEGQPVGIESVDGGGRALPDGRHRDVDHTVLQRVLPQPVAETETTMLETVLSYGTAKVAQLNQFAAGKTGTTTNYGDAWFVGWDHRYTVAVWVGYPDRLVPMTTQFNGGPVMGGTYPALIWHDFMVTANHILSERANRAREHANLARERSHGKTGAGAEEPVAQAPAEGGSHNAPPAGQVRHGSSASPAAPAREPAGAPTAGEGEAKSQPGASSSPSQSAPTARSPTPATPPEPSPAPEEAAPQSASPKTGGASAPAGGVSAPG